MFALVVSVDYEGSELLGLYSSVEAAVEQAQRFMEADELWGDTMDVFRYEVDAAPLRSTFEAPSVWSHRR